MDSPRADNAVRTAVEFSRPSKLRVGTALAWTCYDIPILIRDTNGHRGGARAFPCCYADSPMQSAAPR